MATKKRQQAQDEARILLRRLLPPGSTVYTKVEHVSRSGMFRIIECYAVDDNTPFRISSEISNATHFTYDQRRGGLRVHGTGMNMGFHVVYELSHVLYPEGFDCIGDSDSPSKRCPSNDHSNGDRNYQPHRHRSGGYALRQRWLG